MKRKRLLISLALLAFAALLLFLFRAPILRTAADLWIIDETPTRADAIIVLGGGLQNRPFTAAKLYHQGLAPRIVIFRVKPGPTTELSLTPSEQELTRKLLIAQGVPSDAIVEIGHNVASIMIIVLGTSWVLESRMTSLHWLPEWLAKLADFHPQIRTSVPFIPLALLLGSLFARAGARYPNRTALLICLLYVGIAEVGQIFLPRRTADLRDVACGGLGALVGITIRISLKSRPKRQCPTMPNELSKRK